mgnify:CR=1 FL=1
MDETSAKTAQHLLCALDAWIEGDRQHNSTVEPAHLDGYIAIATLARDLAEPDDAAKLQSFIDRCRAFQMVGTASMGIVGGVADWLP